jgi:hypothetical protein
MASHLNVSSIDVRGVFRMNVDNEDDNDESRETMTTSSSSETESNNGGLILNGALTNKTMGLYSKTCN